MQLANVQRKQITEIDHCLVKVKKDLVLIPNALECFFSFKYFREPLHTHRDSLLFSLLIAIVNSTEYTYKSF